MPVDKPLFSSFSLAECMCSIPLAEEKSWNLAQDCRRYALHPRDAEQRSEHSASCSVRHERISALARSREVECCICLEPVLGKPHASQRRFGLLECEHAFCLECIRSWRSNTEGEADVSTVNCRPLIYVRILIPLGFSGSKPKIVGRDSAFGRQQGMLLKDCLLGKDCLLKIRI